MATPNVIVCDQHSVVRAGVKAALQGIARVIAESADNIEAVKLCRQYKPHVAILGVRMEYNGLLAAHNILNTDGFGTRVILLTADTWVGTIERAKSIHTHGFMLKTTDINCLKDGVKTVAAGREWYDEESTRILLQYANMSRFGRDMDNLTYKEREVLCLAGNGQSNKEISESLNMAVKTVMVHRDSIRQKTGCKDTVAMRKLAERLGFVQQVDA